MNNQAQQIFRKEVQAIINTHWAHLNQPYGAVITSSKHHRTDVKDIEDIDSVKETLIQKLGYIPVFVFLQQFSKRGDYPSPYRNSEKALLLLFMMVEGKHFNEMEMYIPKTSIHNVYKYFFKAGYRENSDWVKESQRNWFSTPQLRAIQAFIYNPPDRKTVTMMYDGHDTRINYNNPKEGEKASRAEMYSYKLKKSGVRTQVLIDILGVPLSVSKMAKCGKNTDQTMFKKSTIHRVIEPTDVLQVDGGYHYNSIIEKAKIELNKRLTKDNFLKPLTKKKKTPLELMELDYNDRFGAQRSSIETTFADESGLFQKFGSGFNLRAENLSILSLENRVCWLLFSIKKFVKIHSIEVQDHHKQWANCEFDFPTKEVEFVDESARVLEEEQKKRRMSNVQLKFLRQLYGNSFAEDQQDDEYQNEDQQNEDQQNTEQQNKDQQNNEQQYKDQQDDQQQNEDQQNEQQTDDEDDYLSDDEDMRTWYEKEEEREKQKRQAEERTKELEKEQKREKKRIQRRKKKKLIERERKEQLSQDKLGPTTPVKVGKRSLACLRSKRKLTVPYTPPQTPNKKSKK